jgi:hypothetical protein
VVETLLSYITHFCLKAQRRKGLNEKERNIAYREARKLFRKHLKSGQPGELLVYFMIEAVLKAPQVLKKMPITTSTEDERKGSDGVHARWIKEDGELEVIFAEAKLHGDFAAAIKDAFKSMSSFHDSETKDHEINYFLNAFSLLPEDQQKLLRSYVEGENKAKCQEVHACLVGYDWDEYECLKDERKTEFLKDFEKRYVEWAQTNIWPKLSAELKAFKHYHLRFEFFFVPFTSVQNFRNLFLGKL